jgi:hypothetical protein
MTDAERPGGFTLSLSQLFGVEFSPLFGAFEISAHCSGRPSCAGRVSFKAGSVLNDIVSAQDLAADLAGRRRRAGRQLMNDKPLTPCSDRPDLGGPFIDRDRR